MLIAFSLSFISRASSFQTIAVCFILLLSLCFQLLFRPFNDSYTRIPLENAAEALVLLTLHFSFTNIRYAFQNPESSGVIIWMLVSVNLVLLCGIIVANIVLLGRPNSGEVHLKVHETAGHEEEAPILPRDTHSSALVGSGAEEDYGTFDDPKNGQS